MTILTHSITTAIGGPDHADRERREQRHLLERVFRHGGAHQPHDEHDRDDRGHDEAIPHARRLACAPCRSRRPTTPRGTRTSLEFLGYRFSFGARDFEERVGAAAVKLGLVPSNDLDEEEVADLVELAADGRIAEARSPLGAYLVRHWERIALVDGESLVYWLRKLVFRGAYLDHRVKEGLLEVVWEDGSGEFAYAEPARRPGAPRARPDAVLARAAVPWRRPVSAGRG